ncbi:MAG: hypothetical protein JSS22_15300, partial [Proteobacteria bacterium]|nr:hypothetical protein [Pseudomonadota bacterium]
MTKIVTIQFNEDDSAEQLMVTFPVGQNANNFHADIQLVQYMIGLIYIHKSEDGIGDWKATMTPAEIRALPDPSVDFRALSKTS